jgi:hypothetical protein
MCGAGVNGGRLENTRRAIPSSEAVIDSTRHTAEPIQAVKQSQQAT